LKSSGKLEEVSATRFRATCASFLVAWHSGIVFFGFVTITQLGWLPSVPDPESKTPRRNQGKSIDI
jgi:hypothetical protein